MSRGNLELPYPGSINQPNHLLKKRGCVKHKKSRKILRGIMKRAAILIYNAINIFYVLKTIDHGTCPIEIHLDNQTIRRDAWVFGKQVL
jgi:hypothetical protein